jgi:hypothetical protein
MIEIISKSLKLILPFFIHNALRTARHKLIHFSWKLKGSPVPPPHRVKQLAVQMYQTKYKIFTLVETGTHLGEMIEMQKHLFKKIVSIELGDDLFTKAQNRFKKYPHITILHGDSGKVLPQLVPSLSDRAIFWLDGHFSAGLTAKGDKECPVYEEIDAIFANNQSKHVILIDDARDFTGKGDYPSIDALREYIVNIDRTYSLTVENDIIRVLPPV